MAEITKIEPLDGTNYQSWKYNMKLVLMERGLWGFALGTEEIPGSDESVAVRNAFRLRSDKAYSLIALSVSKNLQVHIMSTTSPSIAWNTLQQQFEFISVAQVVRLNRKFYAASMKEGEDLMEHVTYMTSLAEQLRELKEDISPRKFATVVLEGLPDSYENFISSLNARNIEDLDWDNIKGSLIEEFMKRKDKNEKQNNSGNDALFLSNRERYSRGNGAIFRGDSHSRRGGPREPRQQQRNQHGRHEDLKGPRCFKCQEFGHIVKNCPLNKRKTAYSHIVEEKHPQEAANNAKVIQSIDFQEMGLISSTKGELSDGWYIDSAASKHMTYEKGILLDFVGYKKPMEIHLGDDTVIFAYGEGKVKLTCCDGENSAVLVLQNTLYVPELAKNLISVPAMAQMGATVTFDKDKCTVSKDGLKLTLGYIVDRKLYRVNSPEFASLTDVPNKGTMRRWHCRYGHLNHDKEIVFYEFNNVEDDDEVADDTTEPTTEDQHELAEELARNVQPVGATYEEHFMEQVRNLEPKRQTKVPARFRTDECLMTDPIGCLSQETRETKLCLSASQDTQMMF
eukprot:gene7491-13268_t